MQDSSKSKKWSDKAMYKIIISDEDIKELEKVVPNLTELLIKGDMDELQIAIMSAIDKTLDKNEEATEETFKLESIADRIDSNNLHRN